MTEVWLPVIGYEGFYQVSNLGRVQNVRSQRLLKNVDRGDGYPVVSLSKHGVAENVVVHRIVIIAFCGQPPFEGAQAAHNDGNQKNCALTNLRWATPTENQADRGRHGTRVLGEDVFGAKLVERSVTSIRQRIQCGERNRPIAEDFGVSISTIHLIRNNRIWKHVA